MAQTNILSFPRDSRSAFTVPMGFFWGGVKPWEENNRCLCKDLLGKGGKSGTHMEMAKKKF